MNEARGSAAVIKRWAPSVWLRKRCFGGVLTAFYCFGGVLTFYEA